MKTFKDLIGKNINLSNLNTHFITEAINTDAMLNAIFDNQIRIIAKLENREIKDVAKELIKSLEERKKEAEDNAVGTLSGLIENEGK